MKLYMHPVSTTCRPVMQFIADNAIDVTPPKLGSFAGRCAEYCSLDHWRMTFILKVVTPGHFDAALASAQRAANRAAAEQSGVPS